MSIEIKVPDLGDGIEQGDVLSVLVKVGDVIKAEQGIVELETDKAVAEVPSPKAGRVAKVHVKAGDTVPVGSTLLTLEESATADNQGEKKKEAPAPATPPKKEAPPAAKKPEPAPAKPAAPRAEPKPAAAAVKAPPRPAEPPVPAERKPAPAAAPSREESDAAGVAAGPAMRRLARELGLDLARVEATGPNGRITKDDVMRTVRAANRAATVVPQAERPAAPGLPESMLPPGEADQDKWGPIVRDRLTRIRATIADRMQQSASTIPHVTNFDDADITELEKIRQSSRSDYAARGVKLTTLPFVIKAIALSLRRHPVINASLDLENGQILYKQYVNVGVAVDTDRGLIVPNIRNADQLGMPQIAQALDDLAGRARSNQFSIDDLRGGTFTISNLGAVGGTYSTPIINAPEVAILLLGRSRKLPVVVEDDVEVRLMLPLSLSYDHRLVDGAAAARFLNDVKSYLEAPGRLLMAP